MDEFLAAPHAESAFTLGVLDFGSRDPADPVDRRDAVLRLKESWPRMQLALWLDREDAVDAAEMNASGIRNIFLKPLRVSAMDSLLHAAAKSLVQQAREQREARASSWSSARTVSARAPPSAAPSTAQSVSSGRATSG